MMSDQPDPPAMTLGLTYWPQRSGFRWWSMFDRIEASEELAQVAALGITNVRLCLRWEDVQPGARRLNSATLRAFEQALDIAEATRLRVTAALFPVALGGALHLPRWASHPDPLNELQQLTRFSTPLPSEPSLQPPVIYDWGYRRNDAPDLFRDPAARTAQLYLIDELVGYFGPHPAIELWQLAEGLEYVRRPAAADAVAEWYDELASAIRGRSSRARVLGVLSERSLTTHVGPRPDHLAASCDLVALAVDTPPALPVRAPQRAAVAVFTQALAAGLAGRPVAVVGLGLPTGTVDDQPGWVSDNALGRQVNIYRASPDQQAEYLSEALPRLQRAGAPGVWLAAYADYNAELWRTPPLDQHSADRTRGLIDGSGREKPAATVVRSFAQSLAAGQPPTGAALDIDPERYWRDPAREFVRLWRDYASDER